MMRSLDVAIIAESHRQYASVGSSARSGVGGRWIREDDANTREYW
jgi:hypothetical protein